MPWSDWQAGRVKLKDWTRTATLESRDGYDALAWPFEEAGTFVWDPVPIGFGSNPEYVYARRNIEITVPGLEAPASYIRYAHHYLKADGWQHDLDWFPSALGFLEEGVDFGIRPGRTEDDDDAYVEYESDTCSFVENLPPLLRSYSNTSTGGGGGGVWDLGAQINGVYVPEHGPIGTPPDEAWMLPFTVPVSTEFASGTETSPTLTYYTDDIPSLPEDALTLTLSAWIPSLGTLESLEVRFEHGVPTLRYQMPRWRYWIPGRLPLQQKQRNDGLALRGAPAWRTRTSRQATNRWSANL